MNFFCKAFFFNIYGTENLVFLGGYGAAPPIGFNQGGYPPSGPGYAPQGGYNPQQGYPPQQGYNPQQNFGGGYNQPSEF